MRVSSLRTHDPCNLVHLQMKRTKFNFPVTLSFSNGYLCVFLEHHYYTTFILVFNHKFAFI